MVPRSGAKESDDVPDAYSFELPHTHAATVYGLHASAATVRRSASSQLLHAFIPWSAENVCHADNVCRLLRLHRLVYTSDDVSALLVMAHADGGELQ